MFRITFAGRPKAKPGEEPPRSKTLARVVVQGDDAHAALGEAHKMLQALKPQARAMCDTVKIERQEAGITKWG